MSDLNRSSVVGADRKLLAVIGGAAGVTVIAVVLLGDDGPESVAEKWVEASTELDFETLCELGGDQYRKQLLRDAPGACAEFTEELAARNEKIGEQMGTTETWDEVRQRIDDTDYSYEVRDTDYSFDVRDRDEDGDRATVQVEVKWEYRGDEYVTHEQREGSSTSKVQLVKEDAAWEVDPDTFDELAHALYDEIFGFDRFHPSS